MSRLTILYQVVYWKFMSREYNYSLPDVSWEQLVMHLSVSSPRGGGGVGHKVGILTFSKKNYQNPHPRAKKGFTSLLLYKIERSNEMHDVRSKSPPWGYRSKSNSRGLSDSPPPPPPPPPPPSDLILIGAYGGHNQELNKDDS